MAQKFLVVAHEVLNGRAHALALHAFDVRYGGAGRRGMDLRRSTQNFVPHIGAR